MAKSGSVNVVVTSWNSLRFTWALESQSEANNSSVVSWKLLHIAGSDGYINSSAAKDWSVTVNGTTVTGTNSVGISNNSTVTLASGKTTIVHNADGSKTFSFSFSQEFGITFQGSSIGTKSGSALSQFLLGKIEHKHLVENQHYTCSIGRTTTKTCTIGDVLA